MVTIVVVVSPWVTYEALVVTVREAVQLPVKHTTEHKNKPAHKVKKNRFIESHFSPKLPKITKDSGVPKER